MDPGLEAALFYGEVLVSEELVYEQEEDGLHSPLTVRESRGGWDVSCDCGYETRVEEFWRALLVAEGHLDAASARDD